MMGKFKKGHIPCNKGTKISDELREKIKKSLAHHRGKNHSNWKGGRTKNSAGYILILNPEHPKAHKDRYVFEHRLVMEKHLGRKLLDGEKIHHRNGIKNDNRLDNLQIVITENIHYGEIYCPFCGKEFLIQ